jgi:hypothetical protein
MWIVPGRLQTYRGRHVTSRWRDEPHTAPPRFIPNLVRIEEVSGPAVQAQVKWVSSLGRDRHRVRALAAAQLKPAGAPINGRPAALTESHGRCRASVGYGIVVRQRQCPPLLAAGLRPFQPTVKDNPAILAVVVYGDPALTLANICSQRMNNPPSSHQECARRCVTGVEVPLVGGVLGDFRETSGDFRVVPTNVPTRPFGKPETVL